MFQELPFPDRFLAARDCGFTAVEILLTSAGGPGYTSFVDTVGEGVYR